MLFRSGSLARFFYIFNTLCLSRLVRSDVKRQLAAHCHTAASLALEASDALSGLVALHPASSPARLAERHFRRSLYLSYHISKFFSVKMLHAVCNSTARCVQCFFIPYRSSSRRRHSSSRQRRSCSAVSTSTHPGCSSSRPGCSASSLSAGSSPR